MEKKFKISESNLRCLIKSVIMESWDDMTNDWRQETIDKHAHNGVVALYHNTRTQNLEDIIGSGELDIYQRHVEGHGHMLFFTVNPDAWERECKISIDIPVEDFDRRFRLINTDSVVTEQNISIDEYNFKILKVKGLEADRIFEILTSDDKRLQDYILNKFFEDIPCIKSWFLQRLDE